MGDTADDLLPDNQHVQSQNFADLSHQQKHLQPEQKNRWLWNSPG
ncbi:hypothetical protein ES705_21394 [subsurface metagenome]